MFTALLDTNVLWPSLQRDFLLSLAAESLYRPIWSTGILDEVVECEVRKRVKRGAEPAAAELAAKRLIASMNDAFDDSCITGWEGLVGTYGLPDPDDEHVLAAAVVGGAGAIVTANHKDFPVALIPNGINITSPQRFALDTVSVHPGPAWVALNRIAARFSNPPMTADQILNALEERYAMVDAVALLRASRPQA